MMISRRSAIAAIAGMGLAPRLSRSAPKATAFGLIGDRYHNSDYIRTALNRTIVKELGIGVDFCDETRRLTAETLQGYKLLIILRDGMIWPDVILTKAPMPGGSPRVSRNWCRIPLSHLLTQRQRSG